MGLGIGASPPMQPILGHSPLKLCEIGQLRLHVGRWDVRNVPLRNFFSSLKNIVVGSDRKLSFSLLLYIDNFTRRLKKPKYASKFIRSTHYHRVHFTWQHCFHQPEPSFPSFVMQKKKQVEFTLSTHIRFPYTRYKVISTGQYKLV